MPSDTLGIDFPNDLPIGSEGQTLSCFEPAVLSLQTTSTNTLGSSGILALDLAAASTMDAQAVDYQHEAAAQSSRSSGVHSSTQQSPFADETFITVPGLTVLRAHAQIVQTIQNTENYHFDLFDPQAVSPFWVANRSPGLSSSPYEAGPRTLSSNIFSSATSSAGAPLQDPLPQNYRPTHSQKLVNHHPIIDVLPWPSVREKILQMLMLPLDFRPPRMKGAGDSMAGVMMQMVFDMKDAGGGLRIWGSDPFNEDNWEVGQVFFEGWWWALNPEIVQKSNAKRLARGADILKLDRR